MRRRSSLPVLLLALALSACSANGPAARESLPCDVSTVMVEVCQRCHGSPPKDGVPISLTTYEDTQAAYTDNALYRSTPVWKIMRDLVRQELMPQPPVVLRAEDRATLLDWLDRGAPPAASGDSCP